MPQVHSLSDLCIKFISNNLNVGSQFQKILPDELYIKILQHLRNQGLLSPSTLSLFLISKIHSINFTSCVQINDECISIITKLCPNIQNLVLAKCPLITDNGILLIARGCLSLKLLHIGKCFQVTDNAFTNLKISSLLDDVCNITNADEPSEKPKECLSCLLELDVSGTKITDESIVFIGERCTDLKLLDISDCNVTVKAIKTIEQKLTSLRMLRASGCHLDYGTCLSGLKSLEGLVARQCPLVGDHAIIDLIKSASSLVTLDLQWSGITDDTLSELSKIASNLVSLRIAWCGLVGEGALSNLLQKCASLQVLDVSWRSLHDDTLRAANENCKNLKLLDISGCNELTEKSLMGIGGTSMEYLSLSWCRGLTDQAFKSIVKRSPNLRTIDISLCGHITPATLSEIANCSKLQALLAFRGTQFADAAFINLAKHLPDLAIINLSECNITDLTMIELSTYANKLRIVVLAGCKAITSKSLISLAKNCSNLETVNVSSCAVGSDGVAALASSCGGLASLTLNGCKVITDNAILALAKHTRVLQNLYISYCSAISEEALVRLAQHCSHLQVIEFSHCVHATDSFICDLVMGSPLLQVVNASGCTKLTDKSLDFMWLYAHHLTSVDVSRCPEITPNALSDFASLMPGVNIRKTGI